MGSGIIQPFNFPYASPVVLVGKKDGSNRLCIDYRKLNKITVFDPEPMTTSADVFEKLCNQWCQSLLSIGADNLQFYPNFALFSTLGG